MGRKTEIKLNELTKHPELIVHYLEWSQSNICVLFDREKRILDCNQAFLHKLHLPDKPFGRDLKEFLRTAGQKDSLSWVTSESTSQPVPNLLSTAASEHTFLVYIYELQANALCLLGTLADAEKDVIETFAVLNSELATKSMELKRINSELREANAKITELSRVDPLTRLYNRRYLQERAEQSISESQRHGHPLSLIMADLDDFKTINDSYGHSAGDTVLQAFAGLIRDQSRTEDLTARLGGEEFTLLLPRTNSEAAFSLAERIRTRLEDMDILKNGVQVTASLGITELKKGEDLDKLLSRADKAMYRAKQNGKNRAEILS